MCRWSGWRVGVCAALVATMCAACEPEACEAGPAEVELGTGTGAFVALEEGDELELVHGFQGGFHTVMGLRLRGMGERVDITMSGTVDGEVLADATVAAQGTCVEQGLDLTELWLIWAADDEALDRAEATIEVEAAGRDGAVVRDEIRVVIDDPWAD